MALEAGPAPSRLAIHETLLLEAAKAVLGDDYVIQNPDAEQLPGTRQPAGHLAILSTRGGIAARVVVDQDECGSRFAERRAEYLSGMDQARGQRPLRHDHLPDHPMPTIQQERDEFLPRFQPETRVKMGEHVCRAANGGTCSEPPRGETPPQFESRTDRRALDWPHTGLRRQLSRPGACNSAQSAVPIEQCVRDGNRIAAAAAGSQQQRQQLAVIQRCGTEVFETFARRTLGLRSGERILFGR